MASPAWGADTIVSEPVKLTEHVVGYFSLVMFVLAYLLVMAEEFTHLRKSKPVIVAAGLIWAVIAAYYAGKGIPGVDAAIKHNIMEYGELLLFLLAAMTYINVMDERLVFDALRSWLVRCSLSYRALFWLTGFLAFFISPVADNMTTALLMGAVVMAVGKSNPRFVSLACINVVVAANAGGAFSPFGDITTLMVWQKGILDFWTFFLLFIPALVNFIVPAVIMHFAIPHAKPDATVDRVNMKRGAKRVIILFFLTIAMAVSFHNFLHIPPVLGMMTGLGLLQLLSYYLRQSKPRIKHQLSHHGANTRSEPLDIFVQISRAEWDTLLFFYGVVMCVGALGFVGYLESTSRLIYGEWGATNANITIGFLSAVVDNIPIMFAVLGMHPEMSAGQWLLVTLTAGVGGSILSIGSAAGVALMGQARGIYTFFSHLRWTPAIILGYILSIVTHLYLNSNSFQGIVRY